MKHFSCILLALLTVCISSASASAVVDQRAIAVDTAIAYDDQNCNLVSSGRSFFLTGDTTCVIRPGKADSDEGEDDKELEELENGFEKSLYYDEIISYDFSDYEKELMARVVMVEANAEPFEGKVAVASVILNRYFGDGYNSIENVVFSPNQFAIADTASDEVLEAVELACKGVDPTGGLRHFVADWCEWQPAHVVLTIGHHNFY